MKGILRGPWWVLLGHEFRLSVGPPLLLLAVLIGGFRVSVWLGLWSGIPSEDLSEVFSNLLAAGLCLAGFPLFERAFAVDLQARRFIFLATLPMRRGVVWAALVASRVAVLAVMVGFSVLLWPELGSSSWLGEYGWGTAALILLLALAAGTCVGLAAPNALAAYGVGLPLVAGATMLVNAYFRWSIQSDSDRGGVELEASLLALFAVSLLMFSSWMFSRGEATDLRQRSLRTGFIVIIVSVCLAAAGVLASLPMSVLWFESWQPGSRWRPFDVSTYSVASSGRFAWYLEDAGRERFSRVSLVDLERKQLVQRAVVRGLVQLGWEADEESLSIVRFDRSPLGRLGYLREPCFQREILDRDGLKRRGVCSNSWSSTHTVPGGEVLEFSGSQLDGKPTTARVLREQGGELVEALDGCPGYYDFSRLADGGFLVLCLRDGARTGLGDWWPTVIESWLVRDGVRSTRPPNPTELRSDLGLPVVWSDEVLFDPQEATRRAERLFGRPTGLSEEAEGFLLFGNRDVPFGPRTLSPVEDMVFFLSGMRGGPWNLWARELPDGDWRFTELAGTAAAIPSAGEYGRDQLEVGDARDLDLVLDGRTGLVAWVDETSEPALWVANGHNGLGRRVAEVCRPKESGSVRLRRLRGSSDVILLVDCRAPGDLSPRTTANLLDLSTWSSRVLPRIATWGEAPLVLPDGSIVARGEKERLIQIHLDGSTHELWAPEQ